MKRHLYYGLIAAAIVLIPAAVGGWWWYYEPAYRQDRLLSEAEKALRANNLDRAEEIFQRLIAAGVDQPRPQLLYAQLLRRLGRNQEAQVALLRATQLGLPLKEGRREYALLEAGDDFELAEPSLKRVQEERPDDVEVIQALTEGYVRSRRWVDAERSCTRWLELQPDRLELLVERGQIRMETGRTDLAAADFREILKRSAKHFQARLLLAQCHLAEARIEEAEAELLVCRQLQPSRPEPLVGLARCALEHGDPDRTQNLVREALALDPSSVLALHVQGDLELRRQRYDLAISVFDQIVRLQPRDKQAHLKLAQALSRSGKWEQARKHERRYQQLDGEEEQNTRKAQRVPSK